MPDRLTIDADTLLPVQAFFNAVDDASFVQVMECLANGIGYGMNDCGCSFPEDLDPGEQTFDGVQFYLFEQTVVISRRKLADYILQVCQDYVAKWPAKLEPIARVLNRMKTPADQAIARALIDLVCFLEFTDDEVINPDAAVSQMEHVAATIRNGGEPSIQAFCLACQVYANSIEHLTDERSDFIRSLPVALGLVEE